ncbi:tyrosine-type recombinase/integrase [Lysinibacter cavernae]|uniref:Integrase n=2 Tax=Lysinibacter cavernae TaxID=1640652 RepID=A0A7X5TSR4_9MICO|nr:site-specific integrase [Lysinibacter cavernae]NIH52508.1 integrase [Lysinibacter cavernae]
MSASLAAAVDAEVLPSNAAARLKLPSPDNAKERYLTKKEAKRLLKQFPKKSRDRALIALLLGTGLRWGEAIGLQGKRVDVKKAVIRVSETWDDRGNRLKDYPKSRRRRSVPVPDWVLAEIKQLVKKQAGQLFRVDGPKSAPLDYSNWRRKVWLPAITAANITDVTIHDLRHTYASWLIQAGVSLEEVGRLLGHVSPLTTRKYAHLAESPTDTILAALSSPLALSPKPSKKESAPRLPHVAPVLQIVGGKSGT